ncbi:unnamed protein product [Amoebophrya sp. A25]|nr:unnamed protein product [Amoebophrya sp. A25]|eukprot:GSA25T00004223001.1
MTMTLVPQQQQNTASGCIATKQPNETAAARQHESTTATPGDQDGGRANRLVVFCDYDATITTRFLQKKAQHQDDSSSHGEAVSPCVKGPEKGLTAVQLVEKWSRLPPAYIAESQRRHDYYFAIENDAHMSKDAKIPYMIKWYEETIDDFVRHAQDLDFKPSHVTDLVHENLHRVELRDGMREVIDYCYSMNIPLVVISAGFGDVIRTVLAEHGIGPEKYTLWSNMFEYNEQIDEEMNITSYNSSSSCKKMTSRVLEEQGEHVQHNDEIENNMKKISSASTCIGIEEQNINSSSPGCKMLSQEQSDQHVLVNQRSSSSEVEVHCPASPNLPLSPDIATSMLQGSLSSASSVSTSAATSTSSVATGGTNSSKVVPPGVLLGVRPPLMHMYNKHLQRAPAEVWAAIGERNAAIAIGDSLGDADMSRHPCFREQLRLGLLNINICEESRKNYAAKFDQVFEGDGPAWSLLESIKQFVNGGNEKDRSLCNNLDDAADDSVKKMKI